MVIRIYCQQGGPTSVSIGTSAFPPRLIAIAAGIVGGLVALTVVAAIVARKLAQRDKIRRQQYMPQSGFPTQSRTAMSLSNEDFEPIRKVQKDRLDWASGTGSPRSLSSSRIAQIASNSSRKTASINTEVLDKRTAALETRVAVLQGRRRSRGPRGNIVHWELEAVSEEDAGTPYIPCEHDAELEVRDRTP